MLLVAIVGSSVLAVIVVTALTGYLLERSAERRDLPHDARPGSPTSPE